MSETQFTLPRGMKDIEPEEMIKRIWLADKIRQVLWSYGFQLLEPSPVENLETLEAKSGPGVREEIYWFKDKAARNLGLRFDLPNPSRSVASEESGDTTSHNTPDTDTTHSGTLKSME